MSVVRADPLKAHRGVTQGDLNGGNGKIYGKMMNAARQSCELGLQEDDPLWPALMSAAEAGDLSRCKQLVSEGADINCFLMECEASALTVALENGHEDVFFWLLDHGAELGHEQYCCDVCGMTYEITREMLLKSAITGGGVRAIESLIARGADWDKRDHSGETPREYAKRIGFHMR